MKHNIFAICKLFSLSTLRGSQCNARLEKVSMELTLTKTLLHDLHHQLFEGQTIAKKNLLSFKKKITLIVEMKGIYFFVWYLDKMIA